MKNQRPQNKYDKMIDDLISYEKKETKKIKAIGLIIAVAGLIAVICSFVYTKYAMYELIGGLALVSIGTSFGGAKRKAIRKYVNQQIRTIQDEQTREALRNQK